MISLENIETAYRDPSLLLERAGDNLACDVSSRTRVIKLLDGVITSGQDRIYVPGESYLLSYQQVEKAVKTRREFRVNGIDIYPTIVDAVLNKKSSFHSVYLLSPTNWGDAMKFIKEARDSEEIRNFRQINENRTGRGGRINREGLVLAGTLDPITPLSKGYEFNGVANSYDRIGNLRPPVYVEAPEAEFTFLSDDHVKIADGNRSVGKHKDGILTLEDPKIVVKGTDSVKIRPRVSKYTLDQAVNFSRLVPMGIGTGGLTGSLFGSMVGLALGGFFEIFADVKVTEFIKYGALELGALGAASLGGLLAWESGRRLKGYEIEGDPKMQIAFSGVVKDRRAEYIEDIYGGYGDTS